MGKLIKVSYKALRTVYYTVIRKYCWVVTYIKFKANGVIVNNNFKANGTPLVNINLKGAVRIGKGLIINSGNYHNMIGRQQKCLFVVRANGVLTIGDNLGISCSALYCADKITIGNNVRIGNDTAIYDTDFHDLNAANRTSIPEITSHIKTGPVVIEDNVFIGSSCTILKNVTIGRNSIVGAGSVVTKSIPADEIWAGNPARFIKKMISR